MENNIFELTTDQLKAVAANLHGKIQEGLQKDGKEIRCLPTFIAPKAAVDKEKVLVLDLGGTNFRATVVNFTGETPVVHDGIKKNLEYVMKAPEGKDMEELYEEIANLVESLNLEGVKSIGYCFSYPCESTPDGDARLLFWTKGVTVKGMSNHLIGKSLMDYLNKRLEKAKFTNIKVINDTVASLFAGLTDTKSQAHIGLIVGTGTNMAALIPSKKIEKLDKAFQKNDLLPVNLESGNFYPPYLTIIDDKIDRYSDNPGGQRFEKAISGMYIGRILEFIFSTDEFEKNFDAEKLTRIMSYPDMYKEKYVTVAHQVYKRSAQLVAASLAGLILTITESIDNVTDIRIVAEGSLFWSGDQTGRKNGKFASYKELVMKELHVLLKEFELGKLEIHVEETSQANLVGSGIAALSNTYE
ncbi:MAG: hexokinase [Tannerella sp.]|jgi:hexokinase|nr:hexokinase [Tannerella sp.]